MVDAVTNYYSKPSGQQGGSCRKMGAGTGRFTIPLWKTKEKITEVIPNSASALDGSNKIINKIAKHVRSMGERRILENKDELRGYRAKKFKAKKVLKKRVRYNDDDEDSGYETDKAPIKRRSKINRALGDDSY